MDFHLLPVTSRKRKVHFSIAALMQRGIFENMKIMLILGVSIRKKHNFLSMFDSEIKYMKYINTLVKIHI